MQVLQMERQRGRQETDALANGAGRQSFRASLDQRRPVCSTSAGTTYAGSVMNGLSGKNYIANAAVSGAVIGDADPFGDICSNPTRTQIQMSGKNIGDLLNAEGITWGAFFTALRPGAVVQNGSLRIRSASAAGGDFLLGEIQLRGSSADRSILRHPVHRG